MKIAVVTGASSGIGREFVRQMDRKYTGLDEIWVIARRQNRLDELKAACGTKIRVLPLDLCEKESLDILTRLLENKHPEVKLLVNASGYGKIGTVADLTADEQTGMVRLNCEALTAVTAAVIPYLSRNSRIIQMASAAAFLPQPKFAVYAATKAYVFSFSRALREELKGRKILVTAVCPGPVKTEFFDIAESKDEIPAYKILFMADPVKVVKRALRDAEAGKFLSVYGPAMKLAYLAAKALPHGLLLKVYK